MVVCITRGAATVKRLACGLRQPASVALRPPWREAAHRAALPPGTRTRRGQAVRRPDGGGVVTWAGPVGVLVPATHFVRDVRGLRRAGQDPHGPALAGLDPASHAIVQRPSPGEAQRQGVWRPLLRGPWRRTPAGSWPVGAGRQGGGRFLG